METQALLTDGIPLNQGDILLKLYTSHTLSTWNSRTFEFGAVIFLAAVFPGTLFYASCYALFRAGVAALLSSSIGHVVDRTGRLRCIRHSIIWQRLPVALSCLLFIFLFLFRSKLWPSTVTLLFSASIILACMEKLAAIANTVAVERDWVILISHELGIERQDLNASMRRIDLTCKLVAPLFVSLVDGLSTTAAIWVVFSQNALSVVVEYFAIAQVYKSVPDLSRPKTQTSESTEAETSEHRDESRIDLPQYSSRRFLLLRQAIRPWETYIHSPAFLASFSLSLLYFTVLSTGMQFATYLFAVGFSPLDVSLIRLATVGLEIMATWAEPFLVRRIGTVRTGLWFVNEQLICIAGSVVAFMLLSPGTKAGGFGLIVGVTLSRLGLWGFDLSVQFLVQEATPPLHRNTFSATESALQSLFELLSFLSTVVFPSPRNFKYPVLISAGAVATSAACFAAFVRSQRGHLLHVDKLRCWKRGKGMRGVVGYWEPAQEEQVYVSGEEDDDGGGSGEGREGREGA